MDDEPLDDEKYLSIDMHRLHQECARQAELYSKHARMRADADKEAASAKNLLKLGAARLEGEIRDQPARFGLAKITDDVVKAAVIRHPEYQRLAKKQIQADHDAAIHATDVEALAQKKGMLEKMVQLRMGDYYADPVLPQASREAAEKARQTDVRSRGQR